MFCADNRKNDSIKSAVVLRILATLSPLKDIRQIEKGKGKGNEPRAIEGRKKRE